MTSDGCEICPRGTYNDEESADLCKTCGVTTILWTTLAPGATNETQCLRSKKINAISISFFVKMPSSFQSRAVNY